jgi:hypothetical protein
MLLGFEIGERWPEAVMHSCGSYFVPVPYLYQLQIPARFVRKEQKGSERIEGEGIAR